VDTDKVIERFERIEGYIDFVYDTAYAAIDSVFYGVDKVYDSLKKRALAHAQRVSGAIEGVPQTPVEKAYALADYMDNNGNPQGAASLRKQADRGIVNITAISALWDGVKAPGRTYTTETPDVPDPAS
jgi:hypothetical protein